MAITKHDMFDFLIDIVPREEIQVKAKAGLKVRTLAYIPYRKHLKGAETMY